MDSALREEKDKLMHGRLTGRILGCAIETAYRADLIVEDAVLLELKSVEALLPVHEAQILTYLKFLKLRVGLLLNFNVTSLSQGMRRFVR